MEPIRFPFRLTNTLFTRFEFKRTPEVPDDLQLNLNAHVKLHSDRLPEQLQIDLQMETVGEQPVTFAVELVALFEAAQEDDTLDSEVARDFVNERAFYVLFALARQKIGEVTYAMGIQPVHVPMPVSVRFPLDEPDAEQQGSIQQ